MKFKLKNNYCILKENISKRAIDHAKEINRPEVVELLSKGSMIIKK